MKILRIISVIFLFVPFALISFSGCGGGKSGPKLTPVTGSVNYKSKALAGATLTFIPIENTEGNGGSAKTDVEGKYKAVYARGGEGLPAGKYKIAISKRVMPDGSAPPEDVSPIESPAKETLPQYSDPEKAKLTKTISEGGGAVDFDLK